VSSHGAAPPLSRALRRETEAGVGHPIVRHGLKAMGRGLFAVLTRTEVRGREHIPPKGPIIVAGNHLGPIDPVLTGVQFPWFVEPMALTDLFRVPGTGTVLRLYGVIPVNRDAHDGGAMRLALEALNAGRSVSILPEGRMSKSGALERARTGVAYLALTSGVPVLPVAVTGTEHAVRLLSRGRRPRLSVAIGPPLRFRVERVEGPGKHERLRAVADDIMYAIADLLPAVYRGVYASRPPMASAPKHSIAAVSTE
jgi:1-acyl-sn-glycerol-3-phosphate acyltransferase